MNYIYIIRCNDNSLYTGWTNNLEKRISSHNKGIGCKYTRGRIPVELVYFEEFVNKSDALRREFEIKKLSKYEKINLIKKKTDSKVL